MTSLPGPDIAYAILPGGWAAAYERCDDCTVVVRRATQTLAVVADATSPTYGGYYLPLGMDVGLEKLSAELSTHDHVCGQPCLRAAVERVHDAMRALDRAVEAERQRLGDIEDRLKRSAVAGGRIAERFGYKGDRLIHTAASVTACLFAGDEVHVAQVGSTRVYRRRESGVSLLLSDHTMNSQLIAAGRPPEEHHWSVVTRVLGFPEEVQPDVATFDVEPGDRFLLCSDGVWLGNAVLIKEALEAPTAQGIAEVTSRGLKTPLRDDAAMIAVVYSG